MIRVLYDEWGFQETHGGVSRLFSEVIKNLPKEFAWEITTKYTSNEYLKASPFNVPVAKMTFAEFRRIWLRGKYFSGANHLYRFLAHLFPSLIQSAEVINKCARIRALKAGNFDVYHADAPDLRWVPQNKPIVETVCDLIPEVIYHDPRRYHDREKNISRISHYITISRNTKRDLQRIYGIKDEKITVIPLGYNLRNGLNVQGVHLGRLKVEKKKYVLFVGKRGGYKNFNWMVRVISPLLKLQNLKLFCTGVAFSTAEKNLLSELGIEDRTIQAFVSDLEMQALFENAIAFIHPSLYEGFGIPILDAFAAGCPAVIANASCFPEVAQDAALYFDPQGDGEDLRQHIVSLMAGDCESPLRQALLRKGRDRVKDFSWKKCALETAAVYRKVLAEFGSR